MVTLAGSKLMSDSMRKAPSDDIASGSTSSGHGQSLVCVCANKPLYVSNCVWRRVRAVFSSCADKRDAPPCAL